MHSVGAVGSVEFAHARLRARWGSRADEATWRRIEVARELAPVLDLARSSALARWVQELTPGSGVHPIEQALRRRWCEQVAEVAGWMAAEWQPAIHWCEGLVDVPLLQAWVRGDPLPAWVADDERLGDLLAGVSSGHTDGRAASTQAYGRPGAPASAWPAGAARVAAWLDAANGQADALLPVWLQTWRALMPAGRARATLERTLVPLLQAHARRFADPATQDGWAERRALGAQLVALMRRHAAEPIEAFVFLALQALELERLRAEIVGRAALPRRTLHA